MASKWFLAVALLLAACGNADPANPVAAAAEVARPSPAAPISDNPHPAEMATHCLRVVGAMITGPQAERCQAEHLWATATDGSGALSDSCLLVRLVYAADKVAKEAVIIPQGSRGMYQTMLELDRCIVAKEFIRLAPAPLTETSTMAENQAAFISFALQAIGEDRKWSDSPTIGSTDIAGMCQAFEVATDETIKRQAKEALGCYLW
jgi:hypothetical protein